MSARRGPRILVLSKNHTGRQMASPGIRAFHTARVLAEHVVGAAVTLATPSAGEVAGEDLPFRCVPYTKKAITVAAHQSDIIIGARFPFYLLPLLYTRRAVMDMFTPFVTEWIELAHWFAFDQRQDMFLDNLSRDLMVQLTLSDFILCANTRQRDLYFGMLSSLGRVTPDTYDGDRWLSKLFTLAPFGVRPDEPKPTRRVLKGVWQGINDNDTVLLWNGGIIEWYDIETLIRAMHRISRQRSDIKLFFLGTEHPDNPNPDAPKMRGLGGGTQRTAHELSRELGLLDTFVFFNYGWVDYEETVNYLCESDIGVCTYFDNLETHFSFRSRILDMLWAELPILCTQGDVWSELVTGRPLGIAVPERNEDAMVDAILRLADDRALREQCKVNLSHEKEAYRWERSLEGLIEYCSRPAGPLNKKSRLLPLATTMASSLQSKLRMSFYRRWDGIRGARPHGVSRSEQ
jgi:glycosyltransferase involved in cell wall biosynthesis